MKKLRKRFNKVWNEMERFSHKMQENSNTDWMQGNHCAKMQMIYHLLRDLEDYIKHREELEKEAK